MVIGIVALASSLNPWIFFISVPLVVVFFRLRKYYLQASREIKRLESVQRSPKYSLLTASLAGVVTIRSRGAMSRFMANMENFQDAHARAFMMFIVSSRWLGSVCRGFFVRALCVLGVMQLRPARFWAATLTVAQHYASSLDASAAVAHSSPFSPTLPHGTDTGST